MDDEIGVTTVEISPKICCFEQEGGQEFNVGDQLDLHFDLKDGFLNKKATILSVENCKLLDEGYEQKIWFLYCAQFDGELESNFFNSIIGAPRICKSFFK